VPVGGGFYVAMSPFGMLYVPEDGETQRLALEYAYRAEPEQVGELIIKLIVHHGEPLESARQHFFDRNTKEVKPNASIAIGMDQYDPATSITRSLMEDSDVLRGAVNVTRRQLRKSDPEKVTLSGLRTAVVTTLVGISGLALGTNPVKLPEEIGLEDTRKAVLDVWTPLLEEFADELEPARRADLLISAPSILAGIGGLAHHAMPDRLRKDGADELSPEQVIELLADVSWSRSAPFVWENIGGKVVTRPAEDDSSALPPRFAVGGPKEVGYQIYRALAQPNSSDGRRIRGRQGPGQLSHSPPTAVPV
jgi:DNA sulfur modification protein DndB